MENHVFIVNVPEKYPNMEQPTKGNIFYAGGGPNPGKGCPKGPDRPKPK